MSGVIGGAGSKSGIIGQTPINVGVDGWHRWSTANRTGATTIDFDGEVFQGTNTSESGGVVTVGRSGWYEISFTLSNQATTATTFQANLSKNGTSTFISTRMYWDYEPTGGDSTELYYIGETKTTVVYLVAGDTVRVYLSTGVCNGHSTFGTSMSAFQGYWIGL